MDWTQIIVAIVGTIGGAIAGGGLMAWFTRREVKEGKALENMQKVVDSMQKSLDAKDRIIEEHEARRTELKADLDRKDAKIEKLLDEKSDLRDEVDDLKTNLAISAMLKCVTLKCIERDPPFGSAISLAGLREEDLIKMAIGKK